MEQQRLRRLPGLPPAARRPGRVQRQVHVRAVRAARRLRRHAARPLAPDLPQLLPCRRPLGLQRPAPGARPGGLTMTYTVLDTLRRQRSDDLREHFALDVLMGFSAENKFLPSKYFYDARGSELFARITDLQEYYPTQCEFEILSRLGGEISEHFPTEPFDIVELGAGDGRKTKVLLSGL